MHGIMKAMRGGLAAVLAFQAAVAWAADDSFTIAVIPDTQNYIDYTHQKAEGFPFDASEMFIEQLQYVADNAASKGGDIVFLSALGDVWQHQTLAMDPGHAARGFKAAYHPLFSKHLAPTEKTRTVEMPMARKGYEILKGAMPFSVVPGNHDYDAMWVDSKFPPAEKIDPKDVSTMGMLHPGGLNNFRRIFGNDSQFFKDKDWYVSSNDGGADSAQVFEAGGYRFLHIGLQFDAPDSSLEWAAKVIGQYPGLPTIVSMHDYMDKEARRIPNALIDGHAADPMDNTPQMIWDKLLSQHDQIFLVLCGHQHGQAMRTDPNRFGNKVYQVLADYQDRRQTAIDAGVNMSPGAGIGDGWMRLMTFDMSDEMPTITVRTYSTRYNKFSRNTPRYAAWYKAQEKPNLSDEAFHGEDDFVIFLDDFRKRFGTPDND